MKINLNVNSYEIKDLTKIIDSIDVIKKLCNNLENLSIAMEKNISIAERDFTSVNMDRTKVVISDLKKELSQADLEFTELLKSVNIYLEKIRSAWNHSWR